LVGGILGILAAILAMFIGGVGSDFEASDSDSIFGLGFSALLASVLGIVGAALVTCKLKVCSLLMFITGICVIFSLGIFSFVLFKCYSKVVFFLMFLLLIWLFIIILAFYVVSVILLIIVDIIRLFTKNHQVDLNPNQQM